MKPLFVFRKKYDELEKRNDELLAEIAELKDRLSISKATVETWKERYRDTRTLLNDISDITKIET